jgi:hypothetical protein
MGSTSGRKKTAEAQSAERTAATPESAVLWSAVAKRSVDTAFEPDARKTPTGSIASTSPLQRINLGTQVVRERKQPQIKADGRRFECAERRPLRLAQQVNELEAIKRFISLSISVYLRRSAV